LIAISKEESEMWPNSDMSIVRFFVQSPEYRNIGLNLVTLGALGALVCTCAQAWGMMRQMKAIHREQSGESIPFCLISYLVFFLAALAVYGMYLNSVTIVFAGAVLAALNLGILVRLSFYKEVSPREIAIVAVSVLMVPAMILFPQKKAMYLAFSAGSVFLSTRQPLQIWRNRSAGVVRLSYLMSFLISGVFWTIFSHSIGDWAMKLVCLASTVVAGVTIVLWFRYRSGIAVDAVAGFGEDHHERY
jgi:uncharacterized protein with PQ loop repeat